MHNKYAMSTLLIQLSFVHQMKYYWERDPMAAAFCDTISASTLRLLKNNLFLLHDTKEILKEAQIMQALKPRLHE